MRSIKNLIGVHAAIHCRTRKEANKIGHLIDNATGNKRSPSRAFNGEGFCLTTKYGNTWAGLDYMVAKGAVIYKASEFLNDYYEIY